MITVGSRWASAWPKSPHLLDVTVVALEQEYVVAQVEHRCTLGCPLQAMRRALPIHGRMSYEYDFFATFFVPMAEDAITLGSGR